MIKWFAMQRGPTGPEPVIFHDEPPPKGTAFAKALIDGSLKRVPAELVDLPFFELVKRMQAL